MRRMERREGDTDCQGTFEGKEREILRFLGATCTEDREMGPLQRRYDERARNEKEGVGRGERRGGKGKEERRREKDEKGGRERKIKEKKSKRRGSSVPAEG